MPKRISVNVGFITNSSSCIFYFPKEVLEDETVKDFMQKYELSTGWVGYDLWARSSCDSFLVTREQKEEALSQLVDEYYSYEHLNGVIDPESEGVYIIYGDEYEDTVHFLSRILGSALRKLQEANPDLPGGYITDYN